MLEHVSLSIEAHDPYARGHSERVARLAIAVAEGLGWDEPELEELKLGAILHDVGKLAVSPRVLCKPASLTPEERDQVRLHPSVGARLVQRWDDARSAVPYVLHHHERWDGRGYPTELAYEEIPLGARLLAIADAYDAMTSDRAYRNALPPDAAFAELARCAGTQFDPDLVDAFLTVWGATAPRAVSA